jgi:RNA polymerase sigma factor (sigma-70 family)
MFARFGSILTRVSAHTGTDAELLERFVRDRDEAAFAALVERHGPMVMGRCRRILGDRHAAEDAFQAAFLVLARKAAGLSRTEALAGWLYGVARRVALKARSAPPPEPLPVREPEGRDPDPLAEMTGREILAVLEEELHRLPAAYRLPVVLCCLEGLTLDEAAARLGCSTAALRGRLERGRVRLRATLAARGLAPTAVLALAGVPRVGTAAILTPALPTRTAQAALHFGSRTGPVPAAPQQLAEAVLQTMFTSKLKLVGAALLATLVLVPALVARNAREHTPTAAAEVADGPGTGEEPEPPRPGTTVTGRVLSEPGGNAVAGVVVTLRNGEGTGRWTTRTGPQGAYSFADIKPGDDYRVWIGDEAKASREAGTWSEWGLVSFKDRPVKAEDLYLEMPQSVSGTVTDADSGEPVSGADINFSTADGNRTGIRTDAAGRYRLFVKAREVDLQCQGTPERYEESRQRRRVTVEAAKHLRGVDFKVKSGPPFSGSVVMPDGKPAKGAEVRVETRWMRSHGAPLGGLMGGRDFRLTADDEGRFRGYMVGARGGADRVRAATVELTVVVLLVDHTAGGVVRVKTTDDDEYSLDPLKVVLAKSSGFRVRVLDPDGKPVTDAEVIATHPAGWNFGLSGPVKNVEEGKYQMTGLIPGLEYHVVVRAAGLTRDLTGELVFQPGVVLKPGEVREIGDIRMEWWGKKAVPGLLKRLASADASDRAAAASQLGELGADAIDAVPALVERLKHDPRNTVRFGSAAALGKIGPTARAAVPDLITALREDWGGGVQREAATALGLIGELSALPALKRASTDSDNEVARAAAEAIKRLEEVAKKRQVSD